MSNSRAVRFAGPIALSLMSASSPPADAAGFLKFDTEITGDATAPGYEKQVEVLSWSWDVGRSISMVGGGGSREASNPSFAEIEIVKELDVSSPALAGQATAGKSLGNATLSLVETGPTGEAFEYATFTLYETLVSSASAGGLTDASRPIERITLNFTKFEFSVDTIDENGKVGVGTPFKWNVEKNEAF